MKDAMPPAESRLDRVVRLALDLSKARAAIARVRALHAVEVMHQLCEDDDCPQQHGQDSDGCRVHPGAVTTAYCKVCSTTDLVAAPCPTLHALDQQPAPDDGEAEQ